MPNTQYMHHCFLDICWFYIGMVVQEWIPGIHWIPDTTGLGTWMILCLLVTPKPESY
jgi:hypothetical protein